MRPWGATSGPHRLHCFQDRCLECGLIFSNPVCDPAELEAFYRDDYWETHWPDALSRDPELVRESVEGQREEVRRLVRHGGRGRLLEIGSGTGGFLSAARDEGFDVWGIETSRVAATHSREVFALNNILNGSVPDERLHAESFDTIFAWHVIEHVTDLDEFVGSMRSLLKQGGLLWIGTENYRNASHYLERMQCAIKRIPAPFSTASEHTMVFDRRTLGDSLERRGFAVEMCETYQPTLAEKKQTMRFRHPASHMYFVAQHAANAIAQTGPLMRVAARKL